MLKWFFLLCVFTISLFVTPIGKKKEESDFQKNFNIAKQHLSQRKIKEALPYLLYLQKIHPKNANLKYLIGVCYAEEEIVNPKTIQLLNEASLKASLEYDPNSLEEERVPIYVFYYLSIAYSQNKMCEEAVIARDKFLEIYPHDDKYYIEESQRWLKVCKGLDQKPEEVPLPKFPDFVPYSSVKKEVAVQKPIEKKESYTNASPKMEEMYEETSRDKPKTEESVTSNVEIMEDTIPQRIVTKRIEYSTVNPLYGVQLGAFKEVVPVRRFRKMKNVDAFMDKQGLIRYVVGHFSINSQAESLLEYIRGLGYVDAFVVNVNNHKKFADEVVSVNDINIRASASLNVKFSVQIGAFKEKIPDRTANMYVQIEGIQEHQEDNYTYLTVGEFKTYEEAKTHSEEIVDSGIHDAFVIAISNGRKVSMKQLNNF